jgi:cobalamin biosynthesis Co2+ chelatase CbiK
MSFGTLCNFLSARYDEMIVLYTCHGTSEPNRRLYNIKETVLIQQHFQFVIKIVIREKVNLDAL